MKLLRTASIERAGENGYPCYRIPGIIATEQGTLIVCYEARSSFSDWSVIDLYARRSLDGGKTWQPRQLLFSGMGKNTANNPVMISDGDRVHFLCLENYKRLFHRVSTDEGRTWSAPVEITDALEACRPAYAQEGYDLVAKEQWTAFSMAEDRATIFGEKEVKTELPGADAEELADAA